MDINGLVAELTSLINEEKQMRMHVRKLKDRREQVEDGIMKFLAETEDPGIKHKNITLTVEEKERRKYRNKTDKIDSAKNVLKKHGVSNSDKVIQDVIEAMRGEPRLETKLCLKKTK